jgi:hypothetical protein
MSGARHQLNPAPEMPYSGNNFDVPTVRSWPVELVRTRRRTGSIPSPSPRPNDLRRIRPTRVDPAPTHRLAATMNTAIDPPDATAPITPTLGAQRRTQDPILQPTSETKSHDPKTVLGRRRLSGVQIRQMPYEKPYSCERNPYPDEDAAHARHGCYI